MSMDGNIKLNLAWITTAYARHVNRLVALQLVDKHGLQGARLPHSLQKAMFQLLGG